MCNFIYYFLNFEAVGLCGTAFLQRYVDARLTVLLCLLVVRQGSSVQEIQTSHENIVKINAAGESESSPATSTFMTDNFPLKKTHFYVVLTDRESAERKENARSRH